MWPARRCFVHAHLLQGGLPALRFQAHDFPLCGLFTETVWAPACAMTTHPGSRPPPIFANIFWNLPIFFIICCICANLFNMVFNSATFTPLPFAMR